MSTARLERGLILYLLREHRRRLRSKAVILALDAVICDISEGKHHKLHDYVVEALKRFAGVGAVKKRPSDKAMIGLLGAVAQVLENFEP